MEENIEIIESLLKSKNINLNDEQLINVDYPYEEWDDPVTRKTRSALSIAIDSENIDIVKLLLSCPNIEINSQTDESVDFYSDMTSFTEYKMGGGWRYIMPLIYDVLEGYDSDYTIGTNKIPIFCHAVEKKNVNEEIIKLLLESEKIDLNKVDDKHKKAFDYAENNEIKELFE